MDADRDPSIDDQHWREANRQLWDERAPAHVAGDVYQVEGLVAGRDDLRPWEPDEVGPVDGLDLLHLQCHIGTDTIGWARRGARVVGLDFSEPALAAAGQLSRRCGLDVEWVQSDVYDAVGALDGRTFDIVYTGVGALNWLPDLARWSGLVHDLLRPGGFLYLYEIHPMWVALGDDGRTIREPAIGTAFQRWEEADGMSYGAPDVAFEHTASYERLHPLGDIVSAVLDARLSLELFHEFDTTPAPTTWLDERADGLWHFPDGMDPFPVSYSLRARRPSSPA
jgi:SAM-dependent methyltransferase